MKVLLYAIIILCLTSCFTGKNNSRFHNKWLTIEDAELFYFRYQNDSSFTMSKVFDKNLHQIIYVVIKIEKFKEKILLEEGERTTTDDGDYRLINKVDSIGLFNVIDGELTQIDTFNFEYCHNKHLKFTIDSTWNQLNLPAYETILNRKKEIYNAYCLCSNGVKISNFKEYWNKRSFGGKYMKVISIPYNPNMHSEMGLKFILKFKGGKRIIKEIK